MILILLESLILLYNKVCIRKSHAFGGFYLNTIQHRFKSRGVKKKPSIRGLRCLTHPMKGREWAMLWAVSRLASEACRGIPWSSIEASVVHNRPQSRHFDASAEKVIGSWRLKCHKHFKQKSNSNQPQKLILLLCQKFLSFLTFPFRSTICHQWNAKHSYYCFSSVATLKPLLFVGSILPYTAIQKK